MSKEKKEIPQELLQKCESQFTDEDWQKVLTPEEYSVMRQQSTERAFTGKYWNHKAEGVYICAACGQKLFDSKDKFESGTGWPSYTQAIDSNALGTQEDIKLGYTRIEVHCSKCGAHLGHVFDDGPLPGGKRFCINSVSLDFKSDSSKSP